MLLLLLFSQCHFNYAFLFFLDSVSQFVEQAKQLTVKEEQQAKQLNEREGEQSEQGSEGKPKQLRQWSKTKGKQVLLREFSNIIHNANLNP